MRSIPVSCLALGLLALTVLPAAPQDVNGTWLLAVDLGAGGAGQATFVFQQDGSAITGTYSGSFGQGIEVTGTAENGRVAFTFVTGQTGEIEYQGSVEGDTMQGAVTYGSTAEGTFEGSRAVAVQPIWGDELVSRVDSLADATLATGMAAAMSIGVQRSGELLLAKGYGLADVENDVPATAETVYRIGSITKQFTAASVMQLVEAGEIGLGDPMTEYLPDYPMQGHEVNIRHLLTHTSGIMPYTGMEEFQEVMRLDLTDEELVEMFSAVPFDFEPGESYQYNSSGYYLLGMVRRGGLGRELSGVPGQPPLRTVGPERLVVLRRAADHSQSRRGYKFVGGELLNDDPLSMNLPGAAGALCSTVPDLLTWTRALRSGRVVSPGSYALMTTPATLNDGSATSYGFGLGIDQLVGHPSVAHGGGINGFNTQLSHYPDEDLDVVVLSNTPGAHVADVAETVAKWALGIEVPPAPTVLDEPITAEQLALYPGVYELAPGFELTVSDRDGELWTQATGQGAFKIRSQGNGRFIPSFDDDVWVEFIVQDGRTTGLILFQGARREARRVR